MKNKFMQTTAVLLIGGFITKLLGMAIRITMSRLMTTNQFGSYMLLMPTFSLLIAISQFGFPTSISKIVSSNKKNNKKLIISILPISFMINILIILFCLCFSKYISIYLLHDRSIYLGLKVMGFVLPFISISSILRGYFFGKQQMLPHVISNIFEDIIRLIVLIIGIPYFIKFGNSFCIMFIVLTNIISEFSSIIIFTIFLPKKFSINKSILIPNKDLINDVMEISIPTTLSRIIGNIGYFFEPIIFTNILLKINLSNDFIIKQYGIINGYIMPLLLLPSFFSNAISQSIIPVVSNLFSNKKYKLMNKKINQALILSFSIGLFMTILFYFFGDKLLFIIYHTRMGIKYLKILSVSFLLFYIESPIISILQAMGYSKITMKCTVYGVIIKLVSILILCYYFKVWGYIFAIIINIIFVTIYNFNILKKKTICLLQK